MKRNSYYGKLQTLLIRSRRMWISILSLLLTFISYSAAVTLSSSDMLEGTRAAPQFLMPFAVLSFCRLAAYWYFRLDRGYWRYVSAHEAAEIAASHIISSLVFLLAVKIGGFSFPSLAILLEFVFSVLLALGGRLTVRLCCEHYLLRNYERDAAHGTVILGAGTSGHLAVKTLLADRYKSHCVIAVLDDDPLCHGMLVHGVPVAGPLSELTTFLKQNPRVSTVVLAIPSLTAPKRRTIEKICEGLHVHLEVNKSTSELLYDSPPDPASPPPPIDKILKRKPQSSDDNYEVSHALSGKRVLITGAGGSIGSELVRQLMSHGPERMILVDKSEFNLYAIGQELAGDGTGSRVELSYHLTDIVNQARLGKLFEEHRPALVFHAAAYKHVPLLENNGYEAFLNNIIGTFNVLKASKAARARRFVLISTDKAVQPSSIMGCTKRICELMVQQVNKPSGAFAFARGADHELETAVVRFGNVINSAGSVVPLFKKQILAGRPITVTDEKVERYFMSIPEAAGLVLTAGTLGSQGEIFMLDMGKPIRITEVAKKMRALYGRRDVPIEIVGLRPGEKLNEELYYSNEEIRTETRFEKVFAVRSANNDNQRSVFKWIAEAAPNLNHLTDAQITRMLRAFVTNVQKRDAEGTDAPSGMGKQTAWTPSFNDGQQPSPL